MDALVEWLGITESHVHVTNCKKDTDLAGRRFDCLIASYNFLGELAALNQDLTFKVVIMDEAHYIKNKKVGALLLYGSSNHACHDPKPCRNSQLGHNRSMGMAVHACMSLKAGDKTVLFKMVTRTQVDLKV